MHCIHKHEFTLEDFSTEHLSEHSLEHLKKTIELLNFYRADYNNPEIDGQPENRKFYWWQMIQLLQSSYNQTRTVMLNYEVLATIYKSRKNHKLDEWSVRFMEWIESLPYSELITGIVNEEHKKMVEEVEKILDTKYPPIGREICDGFLNGVDPENKTGWKEE